MREIKFRAWDDKAKKYLKVCRLGFNGFSHDFWSPSPVSCDIRQADETRYIFEQYTGLKDKNGREIYEGDIYYSKNEQKNLLVEWDNSYEGDSHPVSGFIFYQERIGLYPGTKNYDKIDIKVLGNIHENPELLS